MNHVIKELGYKGTILQRSYRKMTISRSFYYNSFVKVMVKIFGSQNMAALYPILCYVTGLNCTCSSKITSYHLLSKPTRK